MGDSGKKKLFIAGLASILLVAAVVAVVVYTKHGDRNQSSTDNHGGGAVGSTAKSVQAICAPTSYKETCIKSLAGANTTNPKELIQVTFDAAIKNFGDVLKKMPVLKEAATDVSTKDAFDVCQEVLETAVDDLKRSFDKVGVFDPSKEVEYVEDLRTWMGAVVTNHYTCVDAFENTTGDSGEKMKNLLTTARELSSNGLAMVSHISQIFSSLGFKTLGSRRLLSEELKASEEFVDRRLLRAARRGPDVLVAQDGSGQFRTIKEAIARIPKKNNRPFVIHVKAGLYKEYVDIPKGANQVILVGDGPLKTRITGKKCYAKGVKTFQSATVGINGEDFFAKDIAFENTAGAIGHQAVALRVSSDKAVFHNVHIDGYQDTLYNHKYRHYYRECSISGTIDFIFGDSLSLFQDCTFIVRKPGPNQGCMVTAQGRVEDRSNGANVIQNGNFTAEEAFLTADPPHKAYLGRPWKELSRTIIMQSNIEGFIDPTGWAPWMGTFALDTCYYGEYQNRGPGSDTSKRVQWKGIKNITPETAESWTGGKAFGGDEWIVKAGVPYVPTL
ncbi:hypothetical protein ACS0TY_022571 [Phlomoides rotata]